jgi:hypothetical protein
MNCKAGLDFTMCSQPARRKTGVLPALAAGFAVQGRCRGQKALAK